MPSNLRATMPVDGIRGGFLPTGGGIAPCATPQSVCRRLGLIVAFGVLFWPVWKWYLDRMTDGSDEALGWVALVGVVALWWERRNERARWIPAGVVLGASGYLTLLIGGGAALPRAICALIVLASLAIGRRRGAAGMFGLLLLSLPVMASVQFYLGYPMRVFAAWVSDFAFGLVGLDTLREGTVLFWKGAPVVVDAPCSGARMLWCALALHCFLGARRGNGFPSVLIGGLGVVLVVLLGNALRSSVLFLKESGLVAMPEWMHEGIGLLVFALVCLAVARLHSVSLRVRRSWTRWCGAACVTLAIPGAFLLTPPRSVGSEFPGWPARFEGKALVQVPLEAPDERFARDFPGQVARFTDGERWLIVRWVARPTRKLHSTADCLRGMGYTLGERTLRSAPDETRWATFRAWNREGTRLEVRERIADGAGQAWTDVSEWYWHAVTEKTEGPWWAVTVLE